MGVPKLVSAACGALGLGSIGCSAPRALEGSAPAELPTDGASFAAFDAGSGDKTDARTCSGDLRSVLDRALVVVETCPLNEGCAGGECVPACEAAAASRGSIGCDYRVATPSFNRTIRPPCFAAFVANNWPAPATIRVSRDGVSYDVSKFGRIAEAGKHESLWEPVPSTGIPAGKVAVLFLSHDPNSRNQTGLQCPIAPAVSADFGTALKGVSSEPLTGRGQAWRIASDLPLTVYDMLPYGGSYSRLPSAQLVFPTSAWGTNYFGVVPPRGKSDGQWAQLLAAHDKTTVTVRSNVTLPASADVAKAPVGVPTTFVLDAGEYLQWEDSGEMSGTVIQADKPISVTGGHGNACYQSATSPGGGCDSIHQQIPPISAWGSEYAAAPYVARFATPSALGESIVYRFVGAADGTKLSFSPAVPGAPTTLKRGEVVDIEALGGFVVSSQDGAHPFYVAQTMSGADAWDVFTDRLGDEEFVNILPPAQFLTKYVFFTDPSYKTTNLVLIRKKTEAGFQAVKLDCAGALLEFAPLDAAGEYEYARYDLVRDGQPNGGCKNGPHVAESAAPFGLVVWGLDTYASYAYPAGGNRAPINSVVVPPLGPN